MEKIPAETSEVRAGVPLPAKNKGGPRSTYNFDRLDAIGQSFGVFNKTARQVAVAVSKENRKWVTDVVDPTDPNRKIKQHTRRFEVFDMTGKDDPDGAKCRIFRVI